MSQDDAADPSPTAEDLQFILQDTRIVLLQQILAHETGALSAEELIYRNPDLTEENIRYHLRELEDRGIVEGLEIPPGQRQRDLPNTFFAVTETGVRLLKQANLYDEIDVWAEMYDTLERTERIEAIEQLANRPRAERPHDRDPGPEEGSTAAPASGEGKPVVLVADDREELVEMYGTWLADTCSVRTATSGEAALEQMDAAVDVVLLDRRMPDRSGDEVLEELRHRGYDGPVAMLTAVEPDLDILEMSFDDYLIKPVTPTDLRETVERLVTRSGYEETLEAALREQAKLSALESAIDPEKRESSTEYQALKRRLASIQADLDDLVDALGVETDRIASVEDRPP